MSIKLSHGKFLYFVLNTFHGKYSYSIHKVSPLPKRTPRSLPKPVLQLPSHTFPSFMGFFTIGPKIYMFGGKSFGSDVVKNAPYTSCYEYDTRTTPCISNIAKLPSLNVSKDNPIVLGPVYGRYYALSYTLANKDLEEFDPKTQLWKALPPPPLNYNVTPSTVNEKLQFHVYSYGVLNGKLFFCTEIQEVYLFNIISHEWECTRPDMKLNFWGKVEYLNKGGYGYTSSLSNPLSAVILKDTSTFRSLHVSGLRKPSNTMEIQYYTTVQPMGDKMLCILHSGFSRDYCYYHINVDTYEMEPPLVVGNNNVARKGRTKSLRASHLCSAGYLVKSDLADRFICLSISY